MLSVSTWRPEENSTVPSCSCFDDSNKQVLTVLGEIINKLKKKNQNLKPNLFQTYAEYISHSLKDCRKY